MEKASPVSQKWKSGQNSDSLEQIMRCHSTREKRALLFLSEGRNKYLRGETDVSNIIYAKKFEYHLIQKLDIITRAV
jgi:hypothetical protein